MSSNAPHNLPGRRPVQSQLQSQLKTRGQASRRPEGWTKRLANAARRVIEGPQPPKMQRQQGVDRFDRYGTSTHVMDQGFRRLQSDGLQKSVDSATQTSATAEIDKFLLPYLDAYLSDS